MHNDPKLRKAKYDAEKIPGPGHNAWRVEAQREREMSIAGGSAWPDSKIGANGKFAREDPSAQTSIENEQAGISIFDPTLCELAYRWFSAPNHVVLDPFAGGSVRGIVAAKLGRMYVGCELRAEQVAANKTQAESICEDNELIPTWVCGDSTEIEKHCSGTEADFIFSCPPYADLEVYSDDPKDISTMEYDEFLTAYSKIIAASCRMLKNDRFACFVVGDVRDKKGNYRNFVSHTIEAFIQAGLHLYNEAILVTAVGSLPIRAGRTFVASRKLGKTHQNVLVFVKGDGKKAAKECGVIEIQELELANNSIINVYDAGLEG